VTVVLLDAGPLGLVSNPAGNAESHACSEWLETILDAGHEVVIPEIADYEVRRELVRARKALGLARLDGLVANLGYSPITTAIMRRAAELWADARNAGLPTAHDAALDGDVILAAQARARGDAGDVVIVATTNVAHLNRFVDARLWRSIP